MEGAGGRTAHSQVSIKTVAVVLTTALALIAVVYVLMRARISLGLVLVSAVLAVALHRLVDLLSARGIGRRIAISAVISSLVLVFTLLTVAILPPAVRQVRSLVGSVPGAIDRIRRSGLYGRLNERLELDAQVDSLRSELLSHTDQALDAALKALTGVLSLFALGITVFFLTLFMLAFGRPLIRRMLDEALPERRGRYERMLSSMYRSVGGYIGGLSLVCAANAVGTAVFLKAVAHNPYFLPLGLLSGAAAVVPFVGATIAGAVSTGVSFLVAGPWAALATAAWYVVYQQFENHIVGPVVYRRTVAVNPLVLVIAMMILSELFGFIGAIVGVPVVAVAHIVVRELLQMRREALRLPLEGPASKPAEEGQA